MSRTALLISSDSKLRQAIEPFFASHGYSCSFVEDRLEIPKILRKETPQVVLCDKDFSGLNPFLLCKTIKSTVPTNSVCFILVVPRLGMSKAKEASIDMQIDGLLLKPINIDELEHHLKLFHAKSPLLQEGKTFIVTCEDLLTRMMFTQCVTLVGATCLTSDSWLEATYQANNYSSVILVVDAKNLERAQVTAPKSVEEIIIVGDRCPTLKTTKKTLTLPSNFDSRALFEVLDTVCPTKAKQDFSSPKLLDSGFQAIIAARISSAIFNRLLTSEELRRQNWTETLRVIRNETQSVIQEISRTLESSHKKH